MNLNASSWWKWVLPVGVLTLIAGVGLWAHFQVEKAIQTRLSSELTATLEANVTALEIWMQTERKLAQALAKNPEIEAIARSILKKSQDHETDRRFLMNMEEQRALDAALNQQLPDLGFWFAQLVNSNSVIVGDTGPGRFKLGSELDASQAPEFAKVFKNGESVIVPPFRPSAGGRNRRGFRRPPPNNNPPGPSAPSPEGSNDPSPSSEGREEFRGFGRRGGPPPNFPALQSGFMQVAAPVLDESTGQVIGALGFIFNPETAFTRIVSVSRRGESGETFAFDQRGLMISKSRWEENLKKLGLIADRPGSTSALSLELTERKLTSDGKSILSEGSSELILPVREAIQGNNGVTTTPFIDYQGKQSVGVWKWLPDYQFGLALLLEADEAYKPLRILKYIFMILILVIALFGVGVLLLTYLSILWKQRAGEAELKALKLGQYTLDTKIGEGGMGVVYKAHHALLRRETAIKILPISKADPTMIQMFEREVQLTCRLHHPNTIQVYDYGRAPDGSFYYAMEYLEGLNLKDLVARYGPQPESRVIHILSQVCDSLREAHQLGLIHRDIKPANIFLCSRGGVNDFVKTLDFGLVMPIHSSEESVNNLELKLSSSITGTPLYMPPEALENPQSVDERGDIYSLAAVGFYLLTGRALYEGESVSEICEKQMTQTTPSVTDLTHGEVSEEMDRILKTALSKKPSDRPGSVCELKEQLQTLKSYGDWTSIHCQEWWTAWRKETALNGPGDQTNHSTSSESQTSKIADATLVVDLASESRGRSI